jgi:hypothetical protein
MTSQARNRERFASRSLCERIPRTAANG